MKSKTSCFNTTIFKKNFTHYWLLWLAWTAYLMLQLPLCLWLRMNGNGDYYYYGEVVEPGQKALAAMAHVVRAGLSPFPVFIMSVLAALAVFSYLYRSRTANMIHAFPVDRKELYVTNYFSGLLLLLVPEIVTFMVSVLVCIANQITCTQYLFLWLVYIAGVTFFAYALAVFVAMFTGQILAVPVYYFIVNYLYVGCLLVVNHVIALVSYGIVDQWNPGVTCILSPLYYLNNNLRANAVYENELIKEISIKGGNLVGIYAVAAVVLTIAAYRLYKKRNIECAGDLISIGIIKPIFRWGVALCGSVTFSTMVVEALSYSMELKVFPCLLAGVLVFGFLCFFAAEMLLQKGFRVFKKKRLMEWGGFTVIALVFICLFQMDVFGITRYIPKEEEIETAFVYMDYPIEVEKEDMPDLLAIHQKILDEKDFYLENEKNETGHYYTTIVYCLKNGSKVRRSYPIATVGEYASDSEKPAGKILEWEREKENLKRQILGRYYEDNQYKSGSIERYDENGDIDTYVFNTEALETVLEAVNKDIEAGNFYEYYIQAIPEYDRQFYMNGIILSYSNKKGISDNWEYYNTMTAETEDRQMLPENSISSFYLEFGPKCVNTIEALEGLGIVDDTWKLITRDEYDGIVTKNELVD